jgi:YgiT-type zinc finger domain-containing protein
MICEQCRLGRFQPTRTPYLRWLGEHIMVIPDAPAFICDICAQMRYDFGFMSGLQFLLDQFDSDEPVSMSAMHQLMLAENWQAYNLFEGADNLVC